MSPMTSRSPPLLHLVLDSDLDRQFSYSPCRGLAGGQAGLTPGAGRGARILDRYPNPQIRYSTGTLTLA